MEFEISLLVTQKKFWLLEEPEFIDLLKMEFSDLRSMIMINIPACKYSWQSSTPKKRLRAVTFLIFG